MLKVGQRLWVIMKESNVVKGGRVLELYKDTFLFELEGKRYPCKYSFLGNRMYFSPMDVPSKAASKPKPHSAEKRPATTKPSNIPYHRKFSKQQPYVKQNQIPSIPRISVPEEPRFSIPDPPRTPSCDICVLRRGGNCSSLSQLVCDDYHPVAQIPQSERDAFPKMGDASRYRRRSHKK